MPLTTRDRRWAILPVLAILGLGASAMAADAPKNLVKIDDKLSTSGQPAAGYFGMLHKEGFGLVVNLAPPDSQGSLPDEGALVSNNGMIYVNIPVDWHAPTISDFDFFRAVLDGNGHRKTLVHCQLNMRASSFTFLYRAISQGVPPEEARDALDAVWVPDENWTNFMQATLAANGIEFEF
ncbi:MAG: protein tyrosine phosphatase family protein [Gammaproteobacteria bacterium]